MTACIFSLQLSPFFISRGYSLQYMSATQWISSPSSRALFRLNVTYPHEAKIGEDFSIFFQLWQFRNTNVSVRLIKVWMPENLEITLIKDQNLLNTENKEVLVVDSNTTVNVPKLRWWFIGVGYSVEDLNFGNALAIGSNYLASVSVHPLTYDEMTSQISNLQDQVEDLNRQQWGLIFITVYTVVALGIVLPIIQKRRKAISSKANA